jgi:hypothetical protein
MRPQGGPSYMIVILTSLSHINTRCRHTSCRLSSLGWTVCHLGHLCVPSSEHVKMIWEAHYSRVAGHFGMEKIVAVLQKYFYWPKLRQDVSKYIIMHLPVPSPNLPLRNKGYTPLFLLLIGLGSPSPWITCLVYLQPSMVMTVSSWSLIDSLRWQF